MRVVQKKAETFEAYQLPMSFKGTVTLENGSDPKSVHIEANKGDWILIGSDTAFTVSDKEFVEKYEVPTKRAVAKADSYDYTKHALRADPIFAAIRWL